MEDNAKNVKMALWDWRQTSATTFRTKIILLDAQLVSASATRTAAHLQRTTSRLLFPRTLTTMAKVGLKWIRSLSNTTMSSAV